MLKRLIVTAIFALLVAASTWAAFRSDANKNYLPWYLLNWATNVGLAASACLLLAGIFRWRPLLTGVVVALVCSVIFVLASPIGMMTLLVFGLLVFYFYVLVILISGLVVTVRRRGGRAAN